MEESIPLIYDIGVAIAIFITIYRTIVYICKADGISGDTVDFAISFNRVVFPAFGGDTIMPRCPFPIGEIISTIRMAVFLLSHSIFRR